MSQAANNRLLAALSVECRTLLLSRSTAVPLPLKMVLYRAEEMPEYVYFPLSGMASVVISMGNGETTEVATIGSEGVVGAQHLLGPGMVPTDCFIQIEGAAVRVPFSHMRKAFRSSEEIRGRLLEFIQGQASVISQIAGCNRLHPASQRLARWLLMAQDRVQSDELKQTHEFLAITVGAQRSTVSIIASELEQAGLIERRRGQIKFLIAAL